MNKYSIESAIIKYGDKYNYKLVKNGVLVDEYTKFICNKHGVFETNLRNHIRSSTGGCRECLKEYYKEKLIKNKLKNTHIWIKKAKLKHNNKYTYIVKNDKNCTLDIICPIHGKINISMDRHLYSTHGCKLCAKKHVIDCIRLPIKDFIDRCNKIHNNKYDYRNVVFSAIKDKINIICPRHGDFSQTASTHMSGHGCHLCKVDSMKITYDDFVRKANKIHDNEYIYHKDSYKMLSRHVKIKHKKCGTVFRQKASKHVNERQGCPVCNLSIGEKVIKEILNTLAVHYIHQYRVPPQLRLSYDFYIPSLSLLIEYHGEQHYKPVKRFGGVKRYKKQRKTDALKLINAKNNNLNLIVISYKDFKNLNEIIPSLIKNGCYSGNVIV